MCMYVYAVGGGNMETDHCEDLLQTQLLQYPNVSHYVIFFSMHVQIDLGPFDISCTLI